MSTPVDAKVRAQALDIHRSFAVSAPAGSGKTGLLTQRVLALLTTCEAPEELLAITFTRKAAGEMRDRITAALAQAKHQPRPESAHEATTWELAQKVLSRDAELGWSLIESPNRLRIQTIDGLSRQIAKQLPFASGMGSLPEPSEQPEPLYRAAILALYQKLETQHPIAEHLATLLLELDNRYDTFESLLLSLLAQRDQWLGLTLASRSDGAKGFLEESLKSLVIKELDAVYQVLREEGANLCELARYSAANLTADAELAEKQSPLMQLGELHALPRDFTGAALPQSLGHYQALTHLLLTNGKDGQWRKRLDKSMGFPTERAPEVTKASAKAYKERLSELIGRLGQHSQLLAQLQVVRALPAPHYADHQWRLLEALTQVLPHLAAELTLVFSREGCSDFIDTAQAALIALGQLDEPSELALRLDYHIRHILIDEFQDTSVPQRQLIEHLTAGWEPGDGRTLFIVGDGMQSCYGFRNAKVGIFLQAREQGIGDVPLTPLDLQVNFRSQQGVVDWVNTHFQAAFPARDDVTRGQVRYQPSIAARPPLEGQAVQLTLLAQDADQDNLDPNEAEAQAVLELIGQLRKQNPEHSIALLARNRSHLRASLRLLDQAGLRYQATELDNLSNRMAIQDLMSLLRALLDPTDRISWLALLRAPWCGLGNADLHTLIQGPPATPLADGRPSIWAQLQAARAQSNLSTEGQACLNRTVDTLEQVLASQGRKPLRDWLEGCWQALGGAHSLLDVSDLANAQAFFDLLEAHTDGATVRDWQTFTDAVARLYAAPATDADPRLQVMTIHKSKGLEFDQVIIPGLHRLPRADSRELLLWLDQIDEQGNQQVLMSPLSNREESDLYQFIQREKAERTRAEATRLFYVGATRAVKQLHLFACVKRKDGELQPPAKNALLACIWETCVETARVRTITGQGRAPYSPLIGANRIRRLAPSWQWVEPTAEAPLGAYRGKTSAPVTRENPLNRPDLLPLYDADRRAIGIALHAEIQYCTEQAILPDENFVNRQQARITAQLRAALVQQPEAGSHTVCEALLLMAQSDTGRWLLNPNHAHSATELALWEPKAQGAKQWVIDRTFVDQGVRWVIDYKSSLPGTNQTLGEFAAEQATRYQGQLMTYARLARQLGPEAVKVALYFPLCDHFQPVDIA
ncbi:UvrD-helicase domain-containing protein [Simiduia sp. 21SJ11W-1]|uniref:UvrD-helicase domain-containing protein n=1 Tax=Simiduia sp. 21SJ11W-1 TaxID=2909669 RepID=UPI0020A1719F|nr:UvrD-helicase domain-containing protein [Simiduia sp. 21SJ11W-1]UTA46362.1 UvrD-helicase domain-containing protein [Simiduia sp. 21SJ11W-1]